MKQGKRQSLEDAPRVQSCDEIANACREFLNSVSREVLMHQLDKLFDYCQLVIDCNGDYVADVY